MQSVASARAAPASLLALHRQNNRESADLGRGFADHRARVTALALNNIPPTAAVGRLAVLGAGNCNDLDLALLTAHFQQVHLLDLDAEALARAQARQPSSVASKLVLQAPIDLTGAFPRLPLFRTTPATPTDLALLATQSADTIVAQVPGTFEVVLSTCLLSQILQSVYVALGPRHPQLHILACAMALAHLRSAVRLVSPGGQVHLVTDAVSTETYPLLELWDRQPPLALLSELERTENLFSGTAPSFLRRMLATDKCLAPALTGPARLHEPWLWHFSEDRSYLVYALSFTRRAPATG